MRTSGEVELICQGCGTSWLRPTHFGGIPPRLCLDCTTERKRLRRDEWKRTHPRVLADPADVADHLDVSTIVWHAAIEHAAAALRLGRTAEALAVLEAARLNRPWREPVEIQRTA